MKRGVKRSKGRTTDFHHLLLTGIVALVVIFSLVVIFTYGGTTELDDGVYVVSDGEILDEEGNLVGEGFRRSRTSILRNRLGDISRATTGVNLQTNYVLNQVAATKERITVLEEEFTELKVIAGIDPVPGNILDWEDAHNAGLTISDADSVVAITIPRTATQRVEIHSQFLTKENEIEDIILGFEDDVIDIVPPTGVPFSDLPYNQCYYEASGSWVFC